MSTPAFSSQTSDLTAVRFFTQWDPYHYSVDNRPLTDLDANIKSVAGGNDGTRRIAAISFLVQGLLARVNSPADTLVSGLVGYDSGSNTFTVGKGVILSSQDLDTASEDTYSKIAVSFADEVFSVPAPVTIGRSQNYLIQATYGDIDGSAGIPLADASQNSFLEAAQFGYIKFSVKAGVPAISGTQVTPAPDSGSFPLYVVTATNGSPNVLYSYHAGGPARELKHLTLTCADIFPSTSGPAISTNTFPRTYNLPDAASSTVSAIVNVKDILPTDTNSRLKVSVKYTSDSASGNFAVQIGYKTFSTGSSFNATSPTIPGGVEVAPTTTVGNVSTLTSVGYIPCSALVGKELLSLHIDRLGTHASDTCTGLLKIVSVTIEQI